MKRFPDIKIAVVLTAFVILTGAAFGQDLGSSNTLFGAKKKTAPPAKKTTAKNTPAPKKAPAAAPKKAAPKAPAKTTAKKTAPETKNNTAKTTAAGSRNTKKGSENTAADKSAASSKTTTAKTTPAKTVPATGDTGVKPSPQRNTIANMNPGTKAPDDDPSKYTIRPADTIRTPVRDIDGPNILSPAGKGQPDTRIVMTAGQPNSREFNELFERAIEEGNTARDQRNYVKAEGAYLRAQSLKTGDARAIFGLGNLYADQQRWEEAERAYRTAIKLEPNSPEAYVALGFVLSQPIPAANLPERYEEAEKISRRAIQLDSGNAFAHDQLGVALELRGNISNETENSYRKAIQLDSSSALAYSHLARLLSRKGRTQEAAEAYKSAIKLADDVPTMILVADVMQSQQRYTESEQLLKRALEMDPKHPTALMLYGRALTTRGEFGEAEKVLKKSVDVSPQSFVSHTLLGSLYARQGKYDNAERALTQALRVVSAPEMRRLAQEFESVGDGYMRAGKNKDAARVFRQAIALDKEKTGLNGKLSKAEGR